jgi:hypothetical protein
MKSSSIYAGNSSNEVDFMIDKPDHHNHAPEPTRNSQEGVDPQSPAESPMDWINATEPLDHRFQSPDWRWRLAERIVARIAPNKHEDVWVRRLVAAQRRLQRVKTLAAGHHMWLAEPGVLFALQWRNRPDRSERWSLEAYAACGLSFNDIAEAAVLPAAGVEAYLSAFFDIQEMIGKPAALVAQVIGPALAADAEGHDWWWKLAGVVGGKPMVDAVICGYDPRPNSNFLRQAEELVRFAMALRAVNLARGRGTIDKAALQVLEPYIRNSGRPSTLMDGRREEELNDPHLYFMRDLAQVMRESEAQPDVSEPERYDPNVIPERLKNHPFYAHLTNGSEDPKR